MRGITKLFTSRMIATALNILSQFAIIIFLVVCFEDAFVYYYSITLILSALFCIYVINKNMNSGYKIAWILLLLLLPMFGLTIFLMLEGSLVTLRKKRKMLKKVVNELKKI